MQETITIYRVFKKLIIKITRDAILHNYKNSNLYELLLRGETTFEVICNAQK